MEKNTHTPLNSKTLLHFSSPFFSCSVLQDSLFHTVTLLNKFVPEKSHFFTLKFIILNCFFYSYDIYIFFSYVFTY